MFVLSEEKLLELEQLQNQDFLFDLIYEVTKENPALKLSDQFDQLVFFIPSLINQYLERGFDQIDTLKYMVKSHVYLGLDYENNSFFSWIADEMVDYHIDDQVSYVNAFNRILQDYKINVIGENFEYMIQAIENFRNSNFQKNGSLLKIYPQKLNYLMQKNKFDKNIEGDPKIFIFGLNVENNFFIKNINGLDN